MVHCGMLAKAMHLIWTAAAAGETATWAFTGYLVLAAVELTAVSTVGYLSFCALTNRLPREQLDDLSLVWVALLIPLVNLAACFTLPGFHSESKSWAALFGIAMMIAAQHLPTAHAVISWLMTGSAFVWVHGRFMECYQLCFYRSQSVASHAAHADGACMRMQPMQPDMLQPPQSCSTLTLLGHLATRAPVILGVGLVSWLATKFVVIKHFKKLANGDADDCQQDKEKKHSRDGGQHHASHAASSALPFETFGIHIVAALGLRPLLLWLGPWLESKEPLVSESLVVRLVCFPICLYYGSRCLLARFMPELFSIHGVTPDEWLVCNTAFLFLGRDSCNLDIVPLMQRVQAKLNASYMHVPSIMDLIESVRKQVTGGSVAGQDVGVAGKEVEVLELLGEGSFGKVYRGIWQGTVVAVKLMILPSNMGGAEKLERTAIMEAAISSSLSHPNIVQTFAYSMQPIAGPHDRSGAGSEDVRVSGNGSGSSGVHGFEVRLLLEFCDCGTLRDQLDKAALLTEPGNPHSLNYRAVLEIAADVAKGMLHLHSLNVVHADLKARNVLLKSSASEPMGVVAKISDFGLSRKMEQEETHVSAANQGTLSHMAPEVLLQGRQSKASDVYAFGILMWELYTADRPYKSMNKVLVSHQVACRKLRPDFPAQAPEGYAGLAQRCWSSSLQDRPTFEEILDTLVALRTAEGGDTKSLKVERKQFASRPGSTSRIASGQAPTASQGLRPWPSVAGEGAEYAESAVPIGAGPVVPGEPWRHAAAKPSQSQPIDLGVLRQQRHQRPGATPGAGAGAGAGPGRPPREGPWPPIDGHQEARLEAGTTDATCTAEQPSGPTQPPQQLPGSCGPAAAQPDQASSSAVSSVTEPTTHVSTMLCREEIAGTVVLAAAAGTAATAARTSCGDDGSTRSSCGPTA